MKIRNWLFYGIIILIFLIGIIIGMILGIIKGQEILFEGVGIALSGSNTNITIDINETQLINELNKTIVPEFKYIFEKEINKNNEKTIQ